MSIHNDNSAIVETTQQTLKWDCYLHKEPCQLHFNGSEIFHIIPVKDIDQSALQFNCNTIPDEFWESFEKHDYISAIAYTNLFQKFNTFKVLLNLFEFLDKNKIMYTQFNTPADFLKKHIIIDKFGNMTLCNKHLWKYHTSIKPKYTTNEWTKKIIRSIYPNIQNANKKLTLDIPSSILALYKKKNKK